MSKLYTWHWDYGTQYAVAIANSLEEALELFHEGDCQFRKLAEEDVIYERPMPREPTSVHDFGVAQPVWAHSSGWRVWSGLAKSTQYVLFGGVLVPSTKEG